MEKRIILDLCGGTGAWSKPYVEAGYDVRLITLPEHDVRLYKPTGETVHGILAAPPCTHLAQAGARWWKEKGIEPVLENLALVDACLRIIYVSDPVWWALENPKGRITSYLGAPLFAFDPCDFGDPWTKRTLLWGDFVIPTPNPIEPTIKNKIRNMPAGPKRQERRAITPPGFAQAFFEANP